MNVFPAYDHAATTASTLCSEDEEVFNALSMHRPGPKASAAQIADFAREWVRFAARHGLDEALLLLDRKDGDPVWSEALVREMSEDHFGDRQSCVVTDPDAVGGLRVDVHPYDNGSGFAVDHDLAMNHRRSDFTAQFEFSRGEGGYSIYLTDIHVL